MTAMTADSSTDEHTAAVPTPAFTVTPYLSVGDAAGALAFLKQAFGAREVDRWVGPDGRIGHAEVRIGNLALRLADESARMATMGVRSPRQLGGTSVHFFIETPDVQAVVARATAAGARVVEPFDPHHERGPRCRLADPYGLLWTVVTECAG